MKFYIQSSLGFQQTEGMDQDTVTRLLTERGAVDIQYLTEDEYNLANPSGGR